ncbi:hypothetical protein QYE76_019074 [Lolium multiflorum]|uniref:Reverse transcriptase Ty1/copia-type domain-containing protein n=1 Tax=Lolium multiflorum TaxID=4521 RepID=A0AAD8R4A0_LOLMU|nr:hypothetical protein QYE76_019074 [Lolium multiflorum]
MGGASPVLCADAASPCLGRGDPDERAALPGRGDRDVRDPHVSSPPGSVFASPSEPVVEAPSIPAPGRGMFTLLRDNTRREKSYTDGTVLYDPRRHALFAAPVSHTDALREPELHAAMFDEFSAYSQTQTWTLGPRPPGTNFVSRKWVFKTNHRPDGSIDKHKAHLVPRGFTQQHVIDYDDTFSSVVKPATIRLVLSLAVSRGWTLR